MTKKQLTKKSASNKPSKKSGKEKKFQIASGLDLDALTDEELEKASAEAWSRRMPVRIREIPPFIALSLEKATVR